MPKANTRRTLSAQFKFQVALEALKELRSVNEIWRSMKHEWVLLHEYDTLPELAALLGEWIERYNTWRPHAANDGQTPWQAYRGVAPLLEREEIEQKRAAEISRQSASASSLEISESAV